MGAVIIQAVYYGDCERKRPVEVPVGTPVGTPVGLPESQRRRVFFPCGVLRTMTDHLQPSDPANTPDQWDAIARFLAGEASAGESADVRQWLSEHPDDARVVAALDALLPRSIQDEQLAASVSMGALPFGRPVDVESALRRVHAQMETTPAAPTLTVSRSTKAPKVSAPPAATSQSWGKIAFAAAAVAVAAAGITSYRSAGNSAETVAVTYNTPVGTSDSVTLSDGSQVILAAGSRLIVAANYGDGQRNVELQGAGRFTVKHDEKRPFSVRVGSALIKDLGTVFTVKAVDGAGVVVAVTEGSVALSDSSPAKVAAAVNLQAGDRGRMLADGSVVSERGTVTPEEAAWVAGKVVYHDATLAEVQADLRRWYGVELVVADSTLRSRSVTTDLVTTEPAEQFVNRLATMMEGVVTKRGDTLFVDRSGDRLKH